MARTSAAKKPSKGEVISFDLDTDAVQRREAEVAQETDQVSCATSASRR